MSEHDEGAYTLDLLADAAQTGSTQTDLYELMDAYGANSSYGLFDSSGNPKPAAIGIHDLESILKDTGATASTFTPTAVDVTLSGLPSTGESMQLAKSDGTTDLMVWAEPGVGTTAPTVPVTATLDGAYDVKVYDPMLGTDAIATYTDVSSFTLGVTDHPLIAELTPDAGTTTGGGTTTTPPVTTDPGTGGSTTTPPATGSGDGGTTTTSGGTDTGSTTTTPPVTTTPPATTAPIGGDTGSTPVTTDPGTTGSTTPVTTAPTTPAAPSIDVGALTASITQSVTSSIMDALHAKAVARFDANQDRAEANLETYIANHTTVARGDLLATAIVDHLPPGGYAQGGYRAIREALMGTNPTGQAETAAWYDQVLGLGNAPAHDFVAAVHTAHQGASS